MIKKVVMEDNDDNTATVTVTFDDFEHLFVLPMSLEAYFGEMMRDPDVVEMAEHYGASAIHIPSDVETP